jgi:hypothetical protein
VIVLAVIVAALSGVAVIAAVVIESSKLQFRSDCEEAARGPPKPSTTAPVAVRNITMVVVRKMCVMPRTVRHRRWSPAPRWLEAG